MKAERITVANHIGLAIDAIQIDGMTWVLHKPTFPSNIDAIDAIVAHFNRRLPKKKEKRLPKWTDLPPKKQGGGK